MKKTFFTVCIRPGPKELDPREDLFFQPWSHHGPETIGEPVPGMDWQPQSEQKEKGLNGEGKRLPETLLLFRAAAVAAETVLITETQTLREDSNSNLMSQTNISCYL